LTLGGQIHPVDTAPEALTPKGLGDLPPSGQICLWSNLRRDQIRNLQNSPLGPCGPEISTPKAQAPPGNKAKGPHELKSIPVHLRKQTAQWPRRRDIFTWVLD
jgi:hypothetical protein